VTLGRAWVGFARKRYHSAMLVGAVTFSNRADALIRSEKKPFEPAEPKVRENQVGEN
jgi:hypothetical protein